jgi:hypothetical protein
VIDNLGDYEFAIAAAGKTFTASMETIEALGPVEFEAGGGVFTGVPLVSILKHLDVEYSAAVTVRIDTKDGLTVMWNAADAFDAERGYIAFLFNGEPLRERDYPFRSVLLGAGANLWMGQVKVITLIY